MESVEDSKLCAIDENLCYGTLIVTNVNLTLSDGSFVDLVEINVTKGCAKLSDFEDHFTNSRKCWTSNVKEQHASLKNHE